VPAPAFYRQSTGLTAPIDRWQDIEFDAPSFYTLHVRIAEHGAPDEQAFFSQVMYALTPETKTSTHDFWVIARKSGARPAWMDQAHIASQNTVLYEDMNALEALEANLPASGGWQELSINNDRGGLQWRRVFRERLARERAAHESAVLERLEPLSSV
jgi:vanillate O-demethylase monooxygenase subunit